MLIPGPTLWVGRPVCSNLLTNTWTRPNSSNSKNSTIILLVESQAVCCNKLMGARIIRVIATPISCQDRLQRITFNSIKCKSIRSRTLITSKGKKGLKGHAIANSKKSSSRWPISKWLIMVASKWHFKLRPRTLLPCSSQSEKQTIILEPQCQPPLNSSSPIIIPIKMHKISSKTPRCIQVQIISIRLLTKL